MCLSSNVSSSLFWLMNATTEFSISILCAFFVTECDILDVTKQQLDSSTQEIVANMSTSGLDFAVYSLDRVNCGLFSGLVCCVTIVMTYCRWSCEKRKTATHGLLTICFIFVLGIFFKSISHSNQCQRYKWAFVAPRVRDIESRLRRNEVVFSAEAADWFCEITYC